MKILIIKYFFYYNPGGLGSQADLTVVANSVKGWIAHAEYDQCQNMFPSCLGRYLTKTLAQSDGLQFAS